MLLTRFSRVMHFFIVCSMPFLLWTRATFSDAIDYDIKNLVKDELGLTGNPAGGKDIPDVSQSKLAQLGRELFFSKSLSLAFDLACASCHHPFLAGGDGLSLPVGVGALDPDLVGPGRRHDGNFYIDPEADGGPNVERNSPTTFNSALYQHALFNDGRVLNVFYGRMDNIFLVMKLCLNR